MTGVSLRGVEKKFGSVEVIKNVSLNVEPGEFLVFVGPSGSGKSTLLRMIAGLAETSAGTIHIAGRDVTRMPPGWREVAMVFQSYALYPHMTVEQNMSFGLRMTGAPRQKIEQRVAEAARILRIEPLLTRKPKQLSGGQRQRVAIGRAIVRDPKVFLFDEPLSNLDAALRLEMRVEIARIHAEIGATMIYVTHDQVEAMTLADRIVVINHGEIEQIGAPLELYEKPINKFVAGFLGQPKMNFLTGVLIERGANAVTVRLDDCECNDLVLNLPLPLSAGDRITLGVRPDALAVAPRGAGGLPATVKVVEHLGSESIVYASVGRRAEFIAARLQGKTGVRHADPVTLRIDTSRCHVFDGSGLSLR